MDLADQPWSKAGGRSRRALAVLDVVSGGRLSGGARQGRHNADATGHRRVPLLMDIPGLEAAQALRPMRLFSETVAAILAPVAGHRASPAPQLRRWASASSADFEPVGYGLSWARISPLEWAALCTLT
jgi:hypothetical protein